MLKIENSRRMSSRLMGSAAAATLAFAAGAAVAQTQPPSATNGKPATGSEVEEVVVTGSNIRGVAPVGSPIVNLDRKMVEQTAAVSVQQLLQTAAPQVNGFGSSGQTAGAYEPRLRSLGGANSAATLVLVNGHRITPGSNSGASDPNIVPASAVERVEILADGASAVYGSDAVAGVINIITRKNYNGEEANGQYGFGKDYKTYAVGGLFGRSWDSGNVLASYSYSHRGYLFASDRDFVSGNQSNSGPGATGQGGTNFNTFACYPATAVPAAGQPGAGLVFAAPYTGAGLVNSPTLNGLCSTARAVSLLPESTAHRFFVSVNQDFGEHVRVRADAIYSNSAQTSRVSRGTVNNVTVYGPGSTPPGGTGQINPFFTGPPGVRQQTISYDFNGLLGPGAKALSVQKNIMGTLSADVDIGGDWVLGLLTSVGVPTATTSTTGVVSAPNAYLALNGTVVPNGSVTSNAVGNNLGSTTVATRLPLTTANAFNPFSANATGTSDEVLKSLLNGQTYSNSERPIYDFVAKVNGTLFHIPGGDVKVAFGGEIFITDQTVSSATASPLGGGTQSQDFFNKVKTKARRVSSGFAEVIVPLVNEEMNVPLVRSLVFDIAGRIDNYTDLKSSVATTKNPKIGINWSPVEDVTVRGSYGTSFVAPQIGVTQLFTVGGAAGSTITSYFGNGGAAFTLPQGYQNSAALGCPAVGTCTVSAANGREGIVTFGGNPDLRPMTGKEWSLGVDWRPRNFLTGLRASITYWGATYEGVITNQTNVTVAANTPGLESVLVISPTAAQIAAATFGRTATTALPSQIAFLNNTVQQNFFDFDAEGMDFDISYNFPTPIGDFTVGTAGELKTKFTKRIPPGPVINALNVENTTNTFAPIRLLGRGNLEWHSGPVRATLFANYISPYYLTDAQASYVNSPCPKGVTASGNGCQRVDHTLTWDTYVSYDLPNTGWSRNLQLSLNIQNLLDDKPPFINAADGLTGNGSLNTFNNPIGRLVTVGFRKRW